MLYLQLRNSRTNSLPQFLPSDAKYFMFCACMAFLNFAADLHCITALLYAVAKAWSIYTDILYSILSILLGTMEVGVRFFPISCYCFSRFSKKTLCSSRYREILRNIKGLVAKVFRLHCPVLGSQHCTCPYTVLQQVTQPGGLESLDQGIQYGSGNLGSI